jgi:hypothetical protein
MIRKINGDPIGRWTNLNDYLVSKYGISYVTEDITTDNPITVDIVNEEELTRIFGGPNSRRMCTGLNSDMYMKLNKRITTVITKVSYRSNHKTYVVTCRSGWRWDARAFTPPLIEQCGIIDALIVKEV